MSQSWHITSGYCRSLEGFQYIPTLPRDKNTVLTLACNLLLSNCCFWLHLEEFLFLLQKLYNQFSSYVSHAFPNYLPSFLHHFFVQLMLVILSLTLFLCFLMHCILFPNHLKYSGILHCVFHDSYNHLVKHILTYVEIEFFIVYCETHSPQICFSYPLPLS